MGSRFRLDVWRTEESHSARAVAACCSTPDSVKTDCFVRTDRQLKVIIICLQPDLGPMNLISYVCLGVALFLVSSLI